MPDLNTTQRRFYRDSSHYYLRSGQNYSAGEKFEGITENGGTVSILIENTSNTKSFLLDPQLVRAEAKTIVRKYANVDFSGGSSPSTSIVNKNTGHSSSNNDANIVVNPTFSGGNQFSPKLLGSDAGAIKAGESAGAPTNIVEPGDNILLQLENASANPEDASIDIDWVQMEQS